MSGFGADDDVAMQMQMMSETVVVETTDQGAVHSFPSTFFRFFSFDA